MKLDNPFVTKGYAGAEYFCDRVTETETIISMLTNGNNMALISPRRIGKTDILRHVFAQPLIKERYYVFLVDIYATTSLRDFVNIFGRTVLDTLKSRGRKIWEQFLACIKSVQAQVSFDINNNPSWSIGLGDISNPVTTLDEIFRYLGEADKPCLVAFDEFQQVTRYTDEANTEALLRTYIQRCTNATFIFSGSKRHIMTEIFMSPARPFYQSVVPMGLKKISLEKYNEFASNLFSEYGKTLQEGVVEDIYNRFDGITLCLQRMMNVLFLRTPVGGTCCREDVSPAVDYVIDLFSENYASLMENIPAKQREVLVAIANEGEARAITGKKFITKYHLQTASVIMAAVRALLDKDLITKDKNYYSVYDAFFALWIRRDWLS